MMFIVLNIHVPTAERSTDTKDRFYAELKACIRSTTKSHDRPVKGLNEKQRHRIFSYWQFKTGFT